jgi:M6 family metalloprotease-like protein
MEKSRAVAVAVLLTVSIIAYSNPQPINEAFASNTPDESAEHELLGLQDIERWPILRISFPGQDFPLGKSAAFFEGALSAQNYISEMSGGDSELHITLIDGIWESPHPISYWGTDSIVERDAGVDSGGARKLASDAIEGMMDGIDLSPWDLDGDGSIDRLLILHSGEPQEHGGTSTSIWSHFSSINEPPLIDGYSFQHYTMASAHGGIGVIMHEMLHQMGAVDLYDVHSDTPTKPWYGIGDWGIMSSGNWIDNGNLPSLPSSTTLDLIGASDPIILSTNPTSTNVEPSEYVLKTIPDGGNPLMITIAPGEYVWVTYRKASGFDSGIPGPGIIVEQQDTNFGNIKENLVNTDPTKAWVKIVEADGNDALLRARDYGSAGDPFTDSERFGQTGHQIWDNRGRLVPWTITVTSVGNESATVEYDFVGDEKTTVSTPRNPIVLLPNEAVFAEVITDQDCLIVSDLIESNGTTVQAFHSNSEQVQIFQLYNSSPSKGTISGFIGCQGRPATSISLDWLVVNHRLATDSLDATVSWDRPSTVSLYPETEGVGPRKFSITIDGPAGRISDSTTSGQLYPGDPIVLQIDPAGLLEPGMVARGEIVLIDDNNIETRIPITLQAESAFPFWSQIQLLTTPSNSLSLICALFALSVLSGSGPRSNDE